MAVQQRPPSAWAIIIARVLSLGCLIAAAAVRHQVGLALGGLAVGLLLVSVVWRSKAARPGDAFYSASADYVNPQGGQLSGQLSMTPSEIVWVPSRFSCDHGWTEIRIPVTDARGITLRRGDALLDVVLSITGPDGGERRFLTHQNRRLRRAVERFTR